MADDSDSDQGTRIHVNQHYDESLEVADAEEVASQYGVTPSPRVPPGPAGRPHRPGPGESATPTRSSTVSDPEAAMSDSDEFETGETPRNPRDLGGQGAAQQQQQQQQRTDSDDDDDDDSDTSNGDDDDDDDEHAQVEGAYDPADYDHLAVTPEIKDLFQYITRYTPQSIELEHKLKPFIPDFIPAVGDIDAFVKVGRPDSKPSPLGLTVLDEPCAKQSDPTVLDLQLRAISKQTTTKAMQVSSVAQADKNPKAIENWIDSISELHRSKPPPNVHYTKNMPDIEQLMQEWPPEFEDLLNRVGLPTADLDCDLPTYIDLICSILDIPVYKNRLQSLHVLFTLYSEFKNSQHFKVLAEQNNMENVPPQAPLDGQGGADRWAPGGEQ
ncbi:intraflagellar transport protein 46 homolog isoform X1 [Branchiostoma floridae x Branchiostoma belcheri]